MSTSLQVLWLQYQCFNSHVYPFLILIPKCWLVCDRTKCRWNSKSIVLCFSWTYNIAVNQAWLIPGDVCEHKYIMLDPCSMCKKPYKWPHSMDVHVCPFISQMVLWTKSCSVCRSSGHIPVCKYPLLLLMAVWPVRLETRVVWAECLSKHAMQCSASVGLAQCCPNYSDDSIT